MSSPCLSGGGRTYAFDLEIVKSSPSTSSRSSQISSPSSALSESSNSALAISTRKPRTPRKRPNQTYNEAAAILSTAYPNIFSKKHLSSPCKFNSSHNILLLDQSSELLLPFRVFDNAGCLLHQPKQPREPKLASLSSPSSCDRSSPSVGGELEEHFMDNSEEFSNDFGAESILDEEIEEGIDSIMGNLNMNNESGNGSGQMNYSWYGCPMGLGLAKNGVRALRHVDDVNWWDFPIVDMLQISPRLNTNNLRNKEEIGSKLKQNSNLSTVAGDKKKTQKKKKKVEKPAKIMELKNLEYPPSEEESLVVPPHRRSGAGLLLKLNYDGVLNAWSDRRSPFSDEIEGNDVPAEATLAEIDLLMESGGIREASVLRYREKRRTRLFSKKIRYQVRKMNADRRPRMKGRFVRKATLSAIMKDREVKMP